MLRFLWRRLLSSGPASSEELALARYFRDEGLHTELESHLARNAGAASGHERMLYAAHSYFAA